MERDGFKQQVETLRDKISSLSRQIAENEDSSKGKGAYIESLRNELDLAKGSIESLQQEIQQLIQSDALLKEASAAMETDLSTIARERDEHKEKANGLQAEVLALTQRLATNTNDSSEYCERVAALEEELKHSQEQSTATVEGLNNKLQQSEEEIKRLACELEASKLREGPDDVSSILKEAVAGERKQWKLEKAMLQNERDGFSGQVGTLRDKVSELSRQLAALEPSQPSCASQLQYSSDNQDFGQMGEAEDMERMLKDLMAKNKSLTGEKESMQNQVKALMKRVKDLEGEAEDAIASAQAANMSKSSVEKDWTERLVKTEQEWATRLKRAETEREQAMSSKDALMKQAMQKAQAEAQSALQRLRADSTADARRVASKHGQEVTALKGQMEDLKKRLESEHEAAMQQAESQAAQRLAEKDAEMREALATAERDAAEAAAKAEKDASSRTAAAVQEWHHKLEEATAAWELERSQLISDAHKVASAAESEASRRLQEVEDEWRLKLDAAEAAAAAAKDGLRRELDSQIETITRRLHELSSAEARRERRRSELAQEVEGLRAAADEEFRRRCALERALRDAAGAFKRELFEKGEELSALLVR